MHAKHNEVEYRHAEILRGAINEKERTVEVAFSSEEPVERMWGNEILDHSPQSVDLSRLNRGGPLLVEHDRNDQVGKVISARIDPDRTGRATIKFGRSSRANEIWEDVKDGIRSLVSVGYRLKDMVTEKVENGVETLRATAWQPFEISLVSVPADITVGVGRFTIAGGGNRWVTTGGNNCITTHTGTGTQGHIMSQAATEQRSEPAKPAAPQITEQQINEAVERGSASERKRVNELVKLATAYSVPAPDLQRHIAEGKTKEELQQHILEARFKPSPVSTPDPTGIGMSDKEVKRWSLVRAIHCLGNQRQLDGLEREASDAMAKRVGRDASGFFIPTDVVQRWVDPQRTATRELNVVTATQGGYTVGTDVLGSSLIELLRKRALISQLGARSLSGLVGNVAIPKHTGGATAYWLAETAAVTASNQTFGQLALTPHRLAANTAYTKQLLAQSTIDVEAFVRDDIARVLALAKDLAAFEGTGNAGQPTGVKNVTGINTVTFGAAPTWAKVVDFETEVAKDSADVATMAFATTATVRGKWKTTVKVTNQAMFLWEANNTVNGYPAFVTEQITGNIVFFGNWADLILADWDGIDVTVDPFTLAKSNQVEITIQLLCDLGVRHEESFCVSTDSGAQ